MSISQATATLLATIAAAASFSPMVNLWPRSWQTWECHARLLSVGYAASLRRSTKVQHLLAHTQRPATKKGSWRLSTHPRLNTYNRSIYTHTRAGMGGARWRVWEGRIGASIYKGHTHMCIPHVMYTYIYIYVHMRGWVAGWVAGWLGGWVGGWVEVFRNYAAILVSCCLLWHQRGTQTSFLVHLVSEASSLWFPGGQHWGLENYREHWSVYVCRYLIYVYIYVYKDGWEW
jgi:hypothetical protein